MTDLRAIAEAATPGPWRRFHRDDTTAVQIDGGEPEPRVPSAADLMAMTPDQWHAFLERTGLGPRVRAAVRRNRRIVLDAAFWAVLLALGGLIVWALVTWRPR